MTVDAEPPLAVAVIVTAVLGLGSFPATGEEMTLKRADWLPCRTITEPGVARTEGWELESVTVVSEVAACDI